MSASTYRLPTHVSPMRYDVQLNAEVGRDNFSGLVTIAINIHQEKDTIELHSRDLAVSDISLVRDGQSLPADVRMDPDNERIILQFDHMLPKGEAVLRLAFQGKINQHLKGLYLAQNRPEQVLCTQCEATDARAIFPCFDEPAFKAQFAVEVTTPDPVVLSNSSLVSVTDNQSTKTWRFAPTQPMSSYLFALVIGDLAGTEEQVVNGVPLRVWAMRGKERLGAFARDYTARLLPWYEDYFGVPYHFDKYDQAAVPGFAAGAMENSGLVVFRQELLLMDPENISWRQEKNIAGVISHEFAHMWFGNLVTMQWWDDLWLNEAFAQWMAYRVISELSPEYHLWDDFQAAQNYTFDVDALDTTHAIYSPVQTPAQAQELFDAITYVKGCAVLRMLENFIGAEAFRNGLRTYMHEFAESNACGPDLWNNLQAASHKPVTRIMESWILQSGHPCVTATLETDEGGPCLQLSQKRFFINPQAGAENKQIWQIPMGIRYADDAGIHIIRHVLSDTDGTITLPVEGEFHWCTLNANQIGFYRQNLTGPLWQGLLPHLGQLTAAEQIGLLGDQWSLTRRGEQSITHCLEILEALATQGDHYSLVSQLVTHLHTLERMVEDLENEQSLDQFRHWVGKLFHPRLKVLGYEPEPDEPPEISQKRVAVIDALGTLAHDPEVIAQAGILAEREANDFQSVDPNLAGVMVAIYMQFGDEAVYRKYVDLYQERKASGAPPQTVTRYIYNFAFFRDPDLVAQTLSLMEEGIAPQEAWWFILDKMLSFRHARLSAWQFIKNNWSTIKELQFGPMELIKEAGNLPFSMRGDVVEFCEANVKGLADMSYAQALETIDLRTEFQARTQAELAAWLTSAGS